MGLSAIHLIFDVHCFLWDYRRYLHLISKTAIFEVSAPLLEHS